MAHNQLMNKSRAEMSLHNLDFEEINNKRFKKTKAAQHQIVYNLRIGHSLRCQVLRDWTTWGFEKLKRQHTFLGIQFKSKKSKKKCTFLNIPQKRRERCTAIQKVTFPVDLDRNISDERSSVHDGYLSFDSVNNLQTK